MDIIDEYKRGYFLRATGCYKNSGSFMKSYVSNILEKIKDKLPTEDINYITGCFEINQLNLICDPKVTKYNEWFRNEFRYITYCLNNYQGIVNRDEFMKYANPCINFYKYIVTKLKKDQEYREFICKMAYKQYDDKYQIEYAMGLVNQSFCVLIARIASYAYSHNLDPKIIEYLSSLFKHDYMQIIDALEMNGLLYLEEDKCTIKYFKTLLSIISSCRGLQRKDVKVIS